MFSVFAALMLQGAAPGPLPLAANLSQEAHQEVAQKAPHPSEYGPPKSAMSDIKIDIKATGRYSYEATVWVEGKPIEMDLKHTFMPSVSVSRLLGLRYVLARMDSGAKYAPVIPFWMDNRYIMSGPNKVQAAPAALGWGY
jgi:hypothetical protein